MIIPGIIELSPNCLLKLKKQWRPLLRPLRHKRAPSGFAAMHCVPYDSEGHPLYLNRVSRLHTGSGDSHAGRRGSLTSRSERFRRRSIFSKRSPSQAPKPSFRDEQFSGTRVYITQMCEIKMNFIEYNSIMISKLKNQKKSNRVKMNRPLRVDQGGNNMNNFCG